MKQIRLLFIVLGFSASAHSQSIKGKLLDLVDNKPLAGATLTLTPVKGSSQVKKAVSDPTGVFAFQGLSLDSFFLNVSFIGYEEYKQIVAINDSIRDIDLKTIFVPKSTVQLGGVTVTAKAAPVIQKGDTTQFSAGQFKVNPDATTEDLIKKMPGITVDKDGTVTAQGEQVKKVTIDGKDFFGDDASAALRNLPSDIVDKIQVFDRLSDQAQFTGIDDGNSVKALNIVTKSGIKNGQFGRVYAGVGTDGRYAGGGNVSTFTGDRRLSLVGNFNNINQQNFGSQDLLGITSSGGGNRGGGNFGGRGGGGNRGGRGGGGFGGSENFQVGQQSGISKTNAIGLNYSDKWGKKVDVSGSYFFNNSNNANDNLARTETKLDDGRSLFNNQSSLSQSKNYNHRINMRLEYKIDSANSIMIMPSLNFQKNRSLSSSYENSLYGLDDTLNTSTSDRSVQREGYNLRNNILYRHSFRKRGRTFSASFNTTFNKNDGETYSTAHYRFFEDAGVRDSLQNQFTDNPTNGYTLSGNINYTEPLTAKSQLQFNYSPSYSKNSADQQTFEYDQLGGKYTTFKEALSNKFDNTTTTHNGGITYRLGNSRDNQFAVGLSLQYSKLESDRIFPTVTNVDQSFTTILPNLMWSKKLAAKSNVRVFYRASTNFPSVTQLQDVVNNTNELRKSMGNPDLKQSYNHFLSGRYTFTNTIKGQSFFANIFLQAQQDYITNATYIAQQDSVIQAGSILKKGAQLTKPVNMDGYKSFRSFFTFSQPVKFIKSNLNLSSGFSYSKLPGLINNVKSMTDNYTYSAGIGLSSNISEYIDFNLSYNANFNNAKSSVSANTKYINQSAGIQTNFLAKSGWFLQNDISNQTYTGMSDGFNQSYWLWNAGIGKKFLKNRAAELKLSVFDLLKQNQSISRTVEANYIEDSQSRVLQQYFMLTFTYNLKNFGKGRNSRMDMQRRGDRPEGFFP
ncbi:outer membrane beta-barrel protein [Terrimonas pollutisoli]|uniref:outer membrane beta-barrel protein n=1 Tax=Terrimonas pollutisoli TaxID=3034147 RepID=UPI0023EE1F20|nr:outer membrane beta-barrel protein [Terrimonas sp. H1YJ31]